MPYVDADTLKSFVQENNFLVQTPAPAGFAEAVAQADSIIYQHTGIAVPTSPGQAVPLLRNIACALVIWFTTGMQSEVSQQEIERREKLYTDALDMLEKIKTGELPLIDSAGEPISNFRAPAVVFSSTKRLTELP